MILGRSEQTSSEYKRKVSRHRQKRIPSRQKRQSRRKRMFDKIRSWRRAEFRESFEIVLFYLRADIRAYFPWQNLNSEKCEDILKNSFHFYVMARFRSQCFANLQGSSYDFIACLGPFRNFLSFSSSIVAFSFLCFLSLFIVPFLSHLLRLKQPSFAMKATLSALACCFLKAEEPASLQPLF